SRFERLERLEPFELSIIRSRFDAVIFCLLTGYEMVAAQSDFGFFFILWSPGAEAVTVPGHARLELRKSEFLPDLLRPLHEFSSRQGHWRIRPWPRCFDQERRARRHAADMGWNSGRIG